MQTFPPSWAAAAEIDYNHSALPGACLSTLMNVVNKIAPNILCHYFILSAAIHICRIMSSGSTKKAIFSASASGGHGSCKLSRRSRPAHVMCAIGCGKLWSRKAFLVNIVLSAAIHTCWPIYSLGGSAKIRNNFQGRRLHKQQRWDCHWYCATTFVTVSTLSMLFSWFKSIHVLFVAYFRMFVVIFILY